MLLPKTSSEKSSMYSNDHKYNCEVNEDSVHSGSTSKSGSEHNEVDREAHSSDSALIFCISLLQLLDSVCQSNLSQLVLSSSEEPRQKYSKTASGENVALKRNMCPVCTWMHTYSTLTLTGILQTLWYYNQKKPCKVQGAVTESEGMTCQNDRSHISHTLQRAMILSKLISQV